MSKILELKALGYQQITDLAASTALAFVANSTFALIQAEGQDVRWRDDGQDPTASVGNILAAGETLEYDGPLPDFRAIEVVAGAILNVSYYKP